MFFGRTQLHTFVPDINLTNIQSQEFMSFIFTIEKDTTLIDEIVEYTKTKEIDEYVENGITYKASQRLTLLELPPILLIGINRRKFFYNQNHQLEYKKIDSKFVFEETIDLKQFICIDSQADDQTPETQFSFYGCILHIGGANSGHYISIMAVNGNYFLFNDDRVAYIFSGPLDSEMNFL